MKKKFMKIFVPVLIIFIVCAIFMFKQNQETKLSSSNTTTLTNLNLEELKKENLPIVINIASSTCPPCKEMEPIIEKLANEYKDKIIIKTVNIDSDVSGIEDMPIKVTPTLFFFDKGLKPYTPSKEIKTQFLKYARKDTNKHIYTVREGILEESEFREIFKDMGVE